jgi:hypothetical protein
MEADSYANPCMMYAPVSRLHQGCVLLSGFAPASLEIRCITPITRKLQEQLLLPTALMICRLFWRETVRSCSIAAKSSAALVTFLPRPRT